MTIDSKNLVGAGLALAVVGLTIWGSTVFLSSAHEKTGTVEIRPLIIPADSASIAPPPAQ